MANIRVTCPACKTELEIDESFEGQEVECGNCLEVFVAKKPKPPESGSRSGSASSRSGAGSSSRGRRKGDDDDEDERKRKPSRKKPRRRDDDDEEYDDSEDYYSPPPSRSSGGTSGLAITSLILGITAFIPGCCCVYVGGPLALGAIITGAIGIGHPNGKGMSVAGMVLGGVWIFLIVVLVIIGMGANVVAPPQQRFR